jgi:hypothetical protein
MPFLFPCWCYKQFEFPYKLHKILEDAASMDENIISWSPTGHGFKVQSRTAFEAVIMPRYFSSSASGAKFRSFQRQLHIYGFRVVNDVSSLDFGHYHHPLLQKGKPGLCAHMQREKIKAERRNSKTRTPVLSGREGGGSALAFASLLAPKPPPPANLANEQSLLSSYRIHARELVSSGDVLGNTFASYFPRNGFHQQDIEKSLQEFAEHANTNCNMYHQQAMPTGASSKNMHIKNLKEQEEASSSWSSHWSFLASSEMRRKPEVVDSWTPPKITSFRPKSPLFSQDSSIPSLSQQGGLGLLLADIEHDVGSPPIMTAGDDHSWLLDVAGDQQDEDLDVEKFIW